MRPRPSTDGREGPALLVAQTSFLGDVVLTTPLLDALRARLRPRRLAVMVRPDARALLEGHPAVDDVIVDDKRGSTAGIAGIVRQARRLRREGFDLVVSPHRSLRTAVLLAAARIPRRIGFDASRGAWLFHERVQRPRERHDVERNLALLEPFGGWDGPIEVHVPVRAEAARAAAALLGEPRERLVGIAPGSVWTTKRWTEEGFAELVRALSEDGFGVVLLGAPGDQARAQRIAASAAVPVVDLSGRTDLATFVAVVDRLQALVANDSAPMHVAVARRVPVVAVFCATTPALGFGPYGRRAAVVEADLECRPCGRHGSPRCPRGTNDCRHLVEASSVRTALHRLLETSPAAEGSRSS